MEPGTRELLLRRRRARMSPPWVLTIAYLALALPWMVGSDQLLHRWVKDPVRLARLETSGEWLFVAVTALFLFIASRRAFERIRRTMALLDAIFDSVADGIMVLDPDGVVVEVNPAAQRILQAEDAEIRGMDGPAFSRRFRVSHEDGRLVPPEQFISQRAARDGVSLPRYLAVLFRADGSKVIVESSAAPVRSQESGEVVLAVSVMRDVTDQRELDHLRDDFLTTLAHELRTPITAVRLATEHALRSGAGSPAALQQVERSTIRMQRLVDELLEAVRVRVGDLPVDLEWVEILPSLREQVRSFADKSRIHTVTFECDGTPDGRLWMWSDLHTVEEVLGELLDNAVRYSPSGGEIRVSVHALPEVVGISVSDQGIGIPPDRRAHIFERYFRGQRDTPHDYGGMGIGLFICKAKVEALGGRIGFESKQGQGSRFWFTLPRFEPPPAHAPPPAIEPAPMLH